MVSCLRGQFASRKVLAAPRRDAVHASPVWLDEAGQLMKSLSGSRTTDEEVQHAPFVIRGDPLAAGSSASPCTGCATLRPLRMACGARGGLYTARLAVNAWDVPRSLMLTQVGDRENVAAGKYLLCRSSVRR